MSEHHPSCRPSDRDLVWLCGQCGEVESAEYILDEREPLVDALESIADDCAEVSQDDSISQGERRTWMSIAKRARRALSQVKP